MVFNMVYQVKAQSFKASNISQPLPSLVSHMPLWTIPSPQWKYFPHIIQVCKQFIYIKTNFLYVRTLPSSLKPYIHNKKMRKIKWPPGWQPIFLCGLMSDLVIWKEKSLVRHDTYCPYNYWDQVSLDNTNSTLLDTHNPCKVEAHEMRSLPYVYIL